MPCGGVERGNRSPTAIAWGALTCSLSPFLSLLHFSSSSTRLTSTRLVSPDGTQTVDRITVPRSVQTACFSFSLLLKPQQKKETPDRSTPQASDLPSPHTRKGNQYNNIIP